MSAGPERTPPETPVIGASEWHRESDDFSFAWEMHKLNLIVSHLRETPSGLTAEVSVRHRVAGELHWGALNLASTSAREQLVRKLEKIHKGPPWNWLLERACRTTATEFRKGAPIVPLVPMAPQATRDLVDKLLPLEQTTVIHGDGDTGKSFFGMAIALAVAMKTPLPGGLRPTQRTNVLYLDYESTEEDHRERLHALARGLGVEYQGGIFYRDMRDRDLAAEASLLRAEGIRFGIGLYIVDSLGPASVRPGEQWHESAIRTFNAARRFEGATRLFIAHQAGADIEKRVGPARAFGGVFIRNLARSEWEVRRAEDDEQTGHLTMALYHRKHDRGRRHTPIGLQFVFDGDAVHLRAHDLAEHGDLMAKMSMALRIQKSLASLGQTDAVDLAGYLEADEATVSRTLRRLKAKGKVIDFPGDGQRKLWGLRA